MLRAVEYLVVSENESTQSLAVVDKAACFCLLTKDSIWDVTIVNLLAIKVTPNIKYCIS